MTRRDLLRGGAAVLASVAAGCDRNGDAKSSAPKSATPATRRRSAIEVAVIQPQREPCPFVFAGDRLGHLRGDQLVVLHRSNWRVELTLPLEKPHGIGALADGSLAVLENTATTRITTLAPGGTKPTSYAGILGTHHRRRSRLFADVEPARIVVASYDSSETLVDRLALANGAFSREDRLTLLPGDFDSLAALGDGSFVYASPGKSALSHVDFSGKQVLYRLDDANRLLGLVVAGPTAGTVWASKDHGGLIQVTLEDPARVVVTAPGAVYHLARAGTRVAALLVDQAGGRVTAASVVVLDAAAKELWRAPVSTSSTGELEPHWVAGSDAHIAVGTMSELRVFDAVTGQQLTT